MHASLLCQRPLTGQWHKDYCRSKFYIAGKVNFAFLRLWKPWPDDLHIRTWSVPLQDALADYEWTFYVKTFKRYRITCIHADRQTDSHRQMLPKLLPRPFPGSNKNGNPQMGNCYYARTCIAVTWALYIHWELGTIHVFLAALLRSHDYSWPCKQRMDSAVVECGGSHHHGWD